MYTKLLVSEEEWEAKHGKKHSSYCVGCHRIVERGEWFCCTCEDKEREKDRRLNETGMEHLDLSEH